MHHNLTLNLNHDTNIHTLIKVCPYNCVTSKHSIYMCLYLPMCSYKNISNTTGTPQFIVNFEPHFHRLSNVHRINFLLLAQVLVSTKSWKASLKQEVQKLITRLATIALLFFLKASRKIMRK